MDPQAKMIAPRQFKNLSSPKGGSRVSIQETLLTRLQNGDVPVRRSPLEEVDEDRQEQIVEKIFSGFKVASDTRRSNVKIGLNRVKRNK